MSSEKGPQSQQSKYVSPSLPLPPRARLTPPSPVDLTTLSADNLAAVKKQLDDELEHLTGSFQKLRQAQNKFRECITTVRTGLQPG